MRAVSIQITAGQIRLWRRREGRYLLRTNLTGSDPKVLWEYYLQLVEIEAVFKTSRMICCCARSFTRKRAGSKPHLVAFLAYCLSVTLRGHLRKLAVSHPAGGAGEVCCDPNGGRPFSDNRWPRTDFPTLHATGERSENSAGAVGVGTAEQSPPRISAQGKLEEPTA